MDFNTHLMVTKTYYDGLKAGLSHSEAVEAVSKILPQGHSIYDGDPIPGVATVYCYSDGKKVAIARLHKEG